jgi:hypothetical protein
MEDKILNPEEKLEQFFKERRQVADPSFQKKLKESLINDYYAEQKTINTFKTFLFKLKNNMNRKLLQKVAVSGALSALLISGSYLWILRQDKKNIGPIDTASNEENRTGFSPKIKINTGYAFSIPNEWRSRVSSDSKEKFEARFFPQSSDPDTAFIQVSNGKNLKENPLAKAKAVETKNIADWDITTSSGDEDFRESTRKFKSVKINKTGKPEEYFTILAWNPTSQTEENVSKIVDKFIEGDTKNALHLLGYSKAQAASEDKINRVSIDEYKEISVMGEPLKENIDSKGKYYKFQAFKGQRLTAVAFENQQEKGSYIQTELFSDQNRKLYDMGTRIEFKAPYTGTYYFKVTTFDDKSGEALIKIFDRDQTEDRIYIKYSDGREKQYDPSASELQIGESEFVILCEFARPIEILDTYRLKYTRPSEEFKPDMQFEVNVRMYGLKQTLDESNLDKNGRYSVTMPEQEKKNLIPHKMTKISENKYLITKENGDAFSKNYNYYFGVMSDPMPIEGGGNQVLGFSGRFFTENKK